MNKIVADHEQRQEAINPERSFIVRAPAGSGKTELLIQRYLRLLSLVDAPEEIIAITFTRKAAAEMHSRVLTALDFATQESEPEAEHDRQTWHLARAVLKRDKKMDWQLDQNPARLKIQTIDSLCASLTRQMPLLSGLGAQPETLEDASPLYEQAAVNTLAELNSEAHWSGSIARLLIHLDNDLPRIKQLIMDMLGKRDQWLRHVVHDHQREELESALQHLICEKLAQAREMMPKELEAALCEVASFAALNLKESGSEHPTTHCYSISALPGSAITDLDVWSGLCELLLTGKGEWRQKLNVRNGFPPASGNKAESEIRSRMKIRIEGVIHKLKGIPGLCSVLNDIRFLPPANYSDDEWDVVGALCQLLTLAAGQLRLQFAEKNQMDFTGIAHAAIEALGSEDAPADLALMLDYQIKHLLVDEYQDISVNQSMLLERLTAGWSGEDGHTLFLVGDPMQSIYRFREAEVGIFLNTWQNCRLGQVNLVPVTIHTNFRSQPGLVEWVNTTFKSLMSDVEDITTGAVQYEPSTAYHNVQHMRSVTTYPAFKTSGKEEADGIVELVKQLRIKGLESNIAILVRSRIHLFNIIPALREAGLDYQAVDIEGLASQPEVQDLLALIRAVSHLADRTAWLAILRAPWCGLKLDALLTLSEHRKDRTLWDCINDPGLTVKLDTDAGTRLEKFRNVMADALNTVQRHGLNRSVESAWLRLGGPATLQSENQLDNVLIVLEYLAKVGQGGYVEDLPAFISNVEKLFSKPESRTGHPVQLVTIHKAKGLEFDHVILPGLGRKTRNNSLELLLWMQVQKHDQSRDLILAPIRETGRQQAPVYDYINAIEKRKQNNEDIRLLYVAVTRARESLHLFGHANIREVDNKPDCTPQARTFLDHLWAMVKKEFLQALSQYREDTPVEEIINIDQEWKRFPLNWTMSALPEALYWNGKNTNADVNEEHNQIEFEWAGETIKYIGSVVHRCIQQVAQEGIDTWSKDRLSAARPWYELQLRQLGVKGKDLDDACNTVYAALSNFLEDERGQWILGNEHSEAENEYGLTGAYGKKIVSVRLDRTFVDTEGVRWIIDYKTSRHEEGDRELFLDRERERYCDQMEKYAVIMQGMEDRPVKLGLYFPLLQGWRSWDAQAKK